MTGAYLKVVQQVMQHQSITLTTDTYGHLFPGQEAESVGRMQPMLGDHQTAPEALRATGTDNQTAKGAQQSERETWRSATKGCERETEGYAQKKTPKTSRIADLGDGVRRDATNRESSGGGTRTPDTRIMIPLL